MSCTSGGSLEGLNFCTACSERADPPTHERLPKSFCMRPHTPSIPSLPPPPHNTPASAPSSTNDILCVAVQDPFEPVIYIGGHIKLTQGGPWVRRGPPVVTRQLQILGSCGFINNRGGELAFGELGFTGLGGVGRLCCFWVGVGGALLEAGDPGVVRIHQELGRRATSAEGTKHPPPPPPHTRQTQKQPALPKIINAQASATWMATS